MRVAIVSDIHGNRHAFEAVLADAADQGVEERWCLGDVVGYGADPNPCVELAREHCAIVLAGNHDLAVTGFLGIEEFSRGAAISAKWTMTVITPENLAFLSELKPAGPEGPYGLFHASPRDPIWEYVLSELLAERCLDATDFRVSFVGHSHVALAFVRDGPGARTAGAMREAGATADLRDRQWLLNPGSVGQPRDGDPRAAWLLLDTETGFATWKRTRYDVPAAQAAIRDAGLPDSLADRLGYGQ